LLRTLFFGTPEFALSSLEALHAHSEVLAVVTQPDRPRGRGQKLSPCEVKAWALEKNLRTFSPSSLRKESEEKTALLKFIQAEKPDLFLVTAYGLIFPEEFLKLASLGAFNVHASLLPRWRGAAPIQRALEFGDKKTGIALQKIVKELDAGDVYMSGPVTIEDSDYAPSLTSKLAQVGQAIVQDFFSQGGPSAFKPQAQDPALVTYAEKIEKAEGHWQPQWTAMETWRKVRAFSAWPKVSSRLDAETEIKLLECRPSPVKLAGEAGEVVVKDRQCLLICGDQREALEILKIQLPGKSPVSAFDYFQNLKTRAKLRAI
jgi:methionyl-tRNA formyltransferase